VGSPSSLSSFTLEEPNGTYHFTVTGALGYIPAPRIGVVVVEGAFADRLINFSSSLPIPSGEIFGPLTLPADLAIAIVVLSALLGRALLWRRRRRWSGAPSRPPERQMMEAEPPEVASKRD
jgi:hypothetical protein